MSRLFKSYLNQHQDRDKKVIAIKNLVQPSDPFNENYDEPVEPTYEEILIDAKLEAEEILNNAKMEAQRISAELQYEVEQLNEEKIRTLNNAKQEGYQTGFLQGKEEGYKEMVEQIEFAKEIIINAKEDYQQYLDSAEPIILQLGMATAEKILGIELADGENKYSSLVKKALKEIREARQIQLHVNPQHYAFLVSQKEDLQGILSSDVQISIFPDEQLQTDGCIIETENGRLDVSVASQLREIKAALSELLERDQ